MTSAKPPPPARRFEEDKLVVIQWARTAALEELQRAAGAREQWVPMRVPIEREVGFNDLGDGWETPRKSAKPRAPLTSYCAKDRTGYQVVDVAKNGRIADTEAWNAAKQVLKKEGARREVAGRANGRRRTLARDRIRHRGRGDARGIRRCIPRRRRSLLEHRPRGDVVVPAAARARDAARPAST